MHISDLALNDYRSYRSLVTHFPAGAVVLQGRNGRGKTNLVEAISYLSTFSSHRVNADKALLRRSHIAGEEDAVAAVVRARVNYSTTSKLLELEIVQGKANRARLNRAATAPKEILGQLRTVMFAPEDLQLLRGDPAGRRRFIDEAITQLKPAYAALRRDYDRVLRQRGAVLKQLSRSGVRDTAYIDDSLAVWDQAIADLSAQIVVHRLAVSEHLGPLMDSAYGQVSDNDKHSGLTYDLKLASQEERLNLSVDQNIELPLIVDGYMQPLGDSVTTIASRYMTVLAEYRQAELRRAVNLVGAHRDDLNVQLQNMPVKGYASHGETWSVVLALRLAQMQLLTSDDDTPVLILDDVFAELDEGRRQALADSIASVEQVFITAAVPDDVPRSLNAKSFTVTWNEKDGSTVDSAEVVATSSAVEE